jgi:hypothetical protein
VAGSWLKNSEHATLLLRETRGMRMKMTIGDKFRSVGAVLLALLVLAAMWGWVWNIVKLIGLLDGGVTAWMIARAVGVFAAPLGSVLGFF